MYRKVIHKKDYFSASYLCIKSTKLLLYMPSVYTQGARSKPPPPPGFESLPVLYKNFQGICGIREEIDIKRFKEIQSCSHKYIHIRFSAAVIFGNKHTFVQTIFAVVSGI